MPGKEQMLQTYASIHLYFKFSSQFKAELFLNTLPLTSKFPERALHTYKIIGYDGMVIFEEDFALKLI